MKKIGLTVPFRGLGTYVHQWQNLYNTNTNKCKNLYATLLLGQLRHKRCQNVVIVRGKLKLEMQIINNREIHFPTSEAGKFTSTVCFNTKHI